VDEAIKLAYQVNEAVSVLWAHGKIHRDIKPGNVMRRNSGDFVLLDMGLVFDVGAESLTMPGLVPGTAAYLSPEQTDYARKRQLDFRSDHFALGIVVYQAVTGVHPFAPRRGLTTSQVVGNILTMNPSHPSTLREEIGTTFSNIITRLLAKSPHMRYRSCEQFQAALASIQPL
jgi:eukaryotic-like serine/threonine-protein kinase